MEIDCMECEAPGQEIDEFYAVKRRNGRWVPYIANGTRGNKPLVIEDVDNIFEHWNGRDFLNNPLNGLICFNCFDKINRPKPKNSKLKEI